MYSVTKDSNRVRYNRIYNRIIYFIIFLVTITCACAHAQEHTREWYIIQATRNSVTIGISDPVKTGNPNLDNFNAKTQSRIQDSIPFLIKSNQSNIYTERHGVYSYIIGPNGIEKIIVNMVGLYIADHDNTQRYVDFKLNRCLNITMKEEALRFPRSGGSIDIEFIIDNAGISFYLEGDWCKKIDREYSFTIGNGYAGMSSFTDEQVEGKYSVRYRINIAPARNYTNHEVLACHWNCSYETCYYGTFNLVIVQEAESDEDTPVYIG